MSRHSQHDMSQDEYHEFKGLMQQRLHARIKLINHELDRHAGTSLEKVRNEHPEIYRNIIQSAFSFEPESFPSSGGEKAIYWNYESFLHVYIRHCPDLHVPGRRNKTGFQYSPEDIKRLLHEAIKHHIHEIHQRLSEGKDFRISSGQRLWYFNGNYYGIHILETGRISTFYPLNNPNTE